MILKLFGIMAALCLLFFVVARVDTYGIYVRGIGWRLVRPEWVTVFDRRGSPLRYHRVALPWGWVGYRRLWKQL